MISSSLDTTANVGKDVGKDVYNTIYNEDSDLGTAIEI